MFYSRVGSHLSDVEAGMSSYPTVWDDKKPPVAGASPPDHPSYIKDLRNHSSDVRSNDLPLKETVTTRAPMPTVEHTHGPATQTQYHVDATSLYAFALGTFPTSILLLIVLRGVPPRNRDSRSPATSPAIPSTVVTYLDFLDRQQAPPSPQSTDGEYTTSLLSDSTPPSPLYDGEPPDSDIPSTPASPETLEEPVHIARNHREAALDEWELAFRRAFDRVLKPVLHDEDQRQRAYDDSWISYFLRALRRMSEAGLFKEAVAVLVDVVLMSSMLLLLRAFYREPVSVPSHARTAVV